MQGGLAHLVRERFVDAPTSFGARKRAERWEVLLRHFPKLESMRIVDLGGTVETWQRAPVRPAHVTVVNLIQPGESEDPSIRAVTGDACASRATLAAAGADDQYDLVFSNSLIEHVGGHAQRAALAREVHALAPRHWVQTPYRYFPVEPHWIFPLMQFLPAAARARAAAAWPLANVRPDSVADAMAEVQWVELIGIAELRAYFPGSEICKEKIGGLIKSITAVQT
jgi:hypothetical protein